MEFETLINKLDSEAKNLLEQAVATASSRSHYAVELDHVLQQITIKETTKAHTILVACGCNPGVFSVQVDAALEKIKTGNSGFPKISPDITRLLFDAWIIATTQFQSVEITTPFLFLAMVDNELIRLKVGQLYSEWSKLNAVKVREAYEALLSAESVSPSFGDAISKASSKSFLQQYTTNLTESARQGKIESIVGRDHEVRQIVDILTRKKQNNPILTGEAGVGKTAVIEGLALKIVNGEVPENLRDIELLTLDMGLLQAGAGVKGEFENRLKGVIKDVQSSVSPIVLFIDEAHTLIGAGNQSGAGDAANLLKPALARGELRTIAATTWAEYKKYFESDAALTRRFQVVKVDEPSPKVAVAMLRHIAPGFERHHGVLVLDSAIEAAVNLSHRYIAGRQLPDKCVSLLDTACARVSLSLRSSPAVLEKYKATIANINQEINRLQNELSNGYNHDNKIMSLEIEKVGIQSNYDELLTRWGQEKTLITQIVELLSIDAESMAAKERKGHMQKIARLRLESQALSQGQPMVFECVTEDVVAQIVADWTGIPVGKMCRDEVDSVLSLQHTMAARVIGQSHGLELIAKSIRTSRAGLADPNRPVGVFMLVGPSGVGKTETALALAEQLYGSDRLITTINMSEFKEEHKVSMLLGSPPGYVGYGEGGVLTEAVRRNPYSVLLLDEMEKAHPGVHDIFYQVFDKGMLKDGEGRDIDFKNTVIIMTSNTASAEISQLCADPETTPAVDDLLEAINPVLREAYKPAFLGRINVIPYYPLTESNLEKIAVLQLEKIRKRLAAAYQVELKYEDSLLQWIISSCSQSDTGARQIDLSLNTILLPLIAEKILSSVAENNTFACLDICVEGHEKIKIVTSNKNKKLAQKKSQKTITM